VSGHARGTDQAGAGCEQVAGRLTEKAGSDAGEEGVNRRYGRSDLDIVNMGCLSFYSAGQQNTTKKIKDVFSLEKPQITHFKNDAKKSYVQTQI